MASGASVGQLANDVVDAACDNPRAPHLRASTEDPSVGRDDETVARGKIHDVIYLACNDERR
jgi:hypothetical protein